MTDDEQRIYDWLLERAKFVKRGRSDAILNIAYCIATGQHHRSADNRRAERELRFAEAHNRRSWETRRRLLARGAMTADEVSFMDDFDRRAFKRWSGGMTPNDARRVLGLPLVQALQE